MSFMENGENNEKTIVSLWCYRGWNKFIDETKGMNKSEREKVYEVYNSK